MQISASSGGATGLASMGTSASSLASRLSAKPPVVHSRTVALAPAVSGIPANLQVGVQGNLSRTEWSAGSAGYQQVASTGTQAVEGTTTTSASLKIALTSGGKYTFAAGYGNSWKGGRPGLMLMLADSTGKIVKSARTNTLSLSRTETARLSSGDYTLKLSVVPAKGSTAWLTSYTLNASQTTPLPSKSGNADLDAILAGGDYWWHDAGQVAAVSNTGVTDTVKQISGARTTLYYDFLGGSEAYLSTADKNGFAAMDQGQKTAVATALQYLSSLINVKFEAATETNKADIAFGTNQQTQSSGYALYPLSNKGGASVLMLDNLDDKGSATNTGAQLQDRSSYAWHTLVHELGHAMGLKHPGPYNAGGGKAPAPYLSGIKDHRGTTIMSYKDARGSLDLKASGSNAGYAYSVTGITPTSFKVLDIAALQYLYGANTSTTAPDMALSDTSKSYQAVWAPKGVKVDASATTRTNVFDFRAGSYSSISLQTSTDQAATLKAQFKAQGVSDANAQSYATLIVNGKSIKGRIFDGKNTLGLAWGSHYTEVAGGSGNDRFYAAAYTTSVNGGAGNDTLYLRGTSLDWTVAVAGDVKTYTHKLTSGVISARGIEAVAYYKATAAAV